MLLYLGKPPDLEIPSVLRRLGLYTSILKKFISIAIWKFDCVKRLSGFQAVQVFHV